MSEKPPKSSDATRELLGRLFERGKVEASRAAKLGREMLLLRQLRIDRDRMYQKLGKEARHLLEGGELSHPGIARAVERIKEIEQRLEEHIASMRKSGVEPEAEPEGGEGGAS